MAIAFKKATKSQSRLRLALVGPGGSGKTWTSLLVARVLAGPDGRIALIDSERGSASKYADVYDFDVLELDSFSPAAYVEAIAAAEAGGYAVCVIDSLSHAWSGKDGALEQVDRVEARNDAANRRGGKFSAWREVTPMHNRLVDAMLTSRCHIIATMRVKTDYVVDVDEHGKSKPRKVGLAPIQRDGLEYEFDVIGDMTVDNKLIVGKTRCSKVAGAVVSKPDAEFAAILRDWVNDGTPRQPEARACPTELRQKLVEAVKEWSGCADDEIGPAFRAILKRMGVELRPGGKLEEEQSLRVLEWIGWRRGEKVDFAAAVAPPVCQAPPPEVTPPAPGASPSAQTTNEPPAAWAMPSRPGPGHVVYWRGKMLREAGDWSKNNPEASFNTPAEELVDTAEKALGLPRPGQLEEKKAALVYKAAFEQEIDWSQFCSRF